MRMVEDQCPGPLYALDLRSDGSGDGKGARCPASPAAVAELAGMVGSSVTSRRGAAACPLPTVAGAAAISAAASASVAAEAAAASATSLPRAAVAMSTASDTARDARTSSRMARRRARASSPERPEAQAAPPSGRPLIARRSSVRAPGVSSGGGSMRPVAGEVSLSSALARLGGEAVASVVPSTPAVDGGDTRSTPSPRVALRPSPWEPASSSARDIGGSETWRVRGGSSVPGDSHHHSGSPASTPPRPARPRPARRVPLLLLLVEPESSESRESSDALESERSRWWRPREWARGGRAAPLVPRYVLAAAALRPPLPLRPLPVEPTLELRSRPLTKRSAPAEPIRPASPLLATTTSADAARSGERAMRGTGARVCGAAISGAAATALLEGGDASGGGVAPLALTEATRPRPRLTLRVPAGGPSGAFPKPSSPLSMPRVGERGARRSPSRSPSRAIAAPSEHGARTSPMPTARAPARRRGGVSGASATGLPAL